MMLISGSAGVGKTALVGEIHRSVAQKNGFFISGKFDQLRHNIPYSALVQALRGLTREVSAEGQSGMERWKSRIRAALGPNGQLVTRVIPELEQDDRPATPAAGNGSAGVPQPLHCRFTGFHRPFSVKKTIRWLFFWTTCSGWTPILLNWWNGSLRIRRGNLMLFLGAFRDNEVEADHRLTISCEVIKKSGQPVQTILLKPLNPDDTSHNCSPIPATAVLRRQIRWPRSWCAKPVAIPSL